MNKKRTRVHRDKYDKRPLAQQTKEDFEAAMRKHRNYYSTKIKKLRGSKGGETHGT